MELPISPFSPMMLLAGLFTGLLGAYLAYKRGRNFYGWFFVGFFFGILGACAVLLAPRRKATEPPAPPEEPKVPTIQGPKDKFWYYLDPTHQQMGPMSLEALRLAWQQGKISLKTYVWNEELPEWKPLQELLTRG
jgi:hypothetical protein